MMCVRKRLLFGSAFIALNTLGYHFLGSIYDDWNTCLETKN